MMCGVGMLLLYPFAYLKTRGLYRNYLSVRWEIYSVRDGVYYNHFKKKDLEIQDLWFGDKRFGDDIVIT